MIVWTTLDSKTLIQSEWLTVRQETCRLPDGSLLEGYFTWESKDVVMIFAYTEQHQVLLVEQYKHGIGVPVLELPAGYIEPGEAPEVAARRELLEETGYAADAWRLLGDWVIDPTRSRNRFHLFLAEGAERVAEQRLDRSESIRVQRVPLNKALELVCRGEIQVLGSVAAIYVAHDHLQSKS